MQREHSNTSRAGSASPYPPASSLTPAEFAALPMEELLRRMAWEPEGARAMGLSTVHIRPQDKPAHSLTYAVGGRLVRLKGSLAEEPEHLRHARRGEIVGFSRWSRRRLMDFMASINYARLPCWPLMLTLTYPAEYPADSRIYKRHLHAFRRRLFREYGQVGVVWRLEFQERGAPHYHMFVFGVPFLDKAWLAQAWYEVVGSGDPRHLRAGTQVERVRSVRGAMCYTAKYLSKEDDSLSMCGRHWGIWHRELVPVELQTAELSKAEFYRARRLVIKYRNVQGDRRRRRLRARTNYAGVSAYASEALAVGILRHVGYSYLEAIARAIDMEGERL